MKTTREKAMLAIALIGIILSAYAIPLHYSEGGSKLCDISETISCDKVNKSQYSTLLGIPVAILGLLSYLLLFLLVLKRGAIQRALAFTHADFSQYLLFLAAAMCLFQIYLTSMEIFVLNAYCIVCILSQLCMLALVWLSWQEFSSSKN
jgi:vitamin-K-epoxide reductase (warfarin-sensitive)